MGALNKERAAFDDKECKAALATLSSGQALSGLVYSYLPSKLQHIRNVSFPTECIAMSFEGSVWQDAE
eukprot:161494-Amphidinium_carterae.1